MKMEKQEIEIMEENKTEILGDSNPEIIKEDQTADIAKPNKTKRIFKGFLNCAGSYIIIVGVVVFLFTVVLLPVYISGNSMNNTYYNGEVVMALRHSKIRKGDVIVFNLENQKHLIKRVIAEEGDVIDIDFNKGIVTVNGLILDEPYIKEPTHLNNGNFKYPLTVPKDCYFVMGDNRNNSKDSRSPEIGFISPEQIQGKVVFRLP